MADQKDFLPPDPCETDEFEAAYFFGGDLHTKSRRAHKKKREASL